MTRREQLIFDKDVQRREEAYLEEGRLSGEECHTQALEDAEMAYSDYCDTRMEEEKDKRYDA